MLVNGKNHNWSQPIFCPFPSNSISYSLLCSLISALTDYLTIGALATEQAQILITQLTVAFLGQRLLHSDRAHAS